jgi:hypothetical protein
VKENHEKGAADIILQKHARTRNEEQEIQTQPE